MSALQPSTAPVGRHVIAIACAAVLSCISLPSAHAERAPIQRFMAAPLQDGNRFPIYPGTLTFISFTSPILDTFGINPEPWKAEVTPHNVLNLYRVYLPPDTRADDIARVMAVITRDGVYYVEFVAADSLDEAPKGFVVSHLEASQHQVTKALEAVAKQDADGQAGKPAGKITTQPQPSRRGKAMGPASVDEFAERVMVRGLVAGHSSVRIDQPSQTGRGMFIRGVEWVASGERKFLRFVMENRLPDETEIATVEVQDDYGNDHAGAAHIGEPDRPTGTLLATLKPGEIVTGTVAVHDFHSLSGEVRLVAKGPGGVPAGFRVIPVDPPIPPPLTPRQKRARRVVIGPSLQVGAFWLADGQGTNRLKATRFQAFGVQVVKGLHENWAVEAGFSGGTTGTVRFADTTIDSTQGELTRSATFGRVGFAGVLRFGDTVNPYLRLGIGAQGTSYSVAFSPESGPAPEIDSPFELQLMLNVGGGVHIQLGERLVFGLAALIVQDFKQEQKSLHAGMSLSYGL